MKRRKYPKKKVSQVPRIEIVERREPPLDLEKPGQYTDYWKAAASAAQVEPPGGRPR